MKKLFCTLFFAAVYLSVGAQNKPAPKPKPTTTVIKDPVMKTALDSASYAIGIFVVNFYKQQGINQINTTFVSKAINDAQGNKPMALNDTEANSAIMNYINKAQAEKSKTNILAGEQFLEKNKKRQGVITTASGLQYEVITSGNGPLPLLSDSVVCHYKGSFLDGTVFENSYESGKPVTFTVNGVIKGWTEALQLMHAGSKWKLYIPYQLGYGVNDYFAIPGGSLLIFEIELLEVKGK